MSIESKTSGMEELPFEPGNTVPNGNVQVGTTYDPFVVNHPGNPEWSVVFTRRGGNILTLNHKRDRDGKYRSGGPWLMWKEENRTMLSSHSIAIRPNFFKWYSGRFRIRSHNAPYYTPSAWDSVNSLNAGSTALLSRGAEAWNRLRPDNPDFSLATSLYETRDFFPTVQSILRGIVRRVAGVSARRRREGRSTLSKAGQWHLAIQFGYLPILRDIRNGVQAHRASSKRLDQLIRDNGKPVRRRTRLRDTSVAKTHTAFTNGYNGGTNVYLTPSSVTQSHWFGTGMGSITVVKNSSETWAEGRFRYILPPRPRDPEGSRGWNRRMYRYIMGGRITPSNLYQAMPWSWLVDYFTDLGHFIKATSSGVADRLIADYAYLMQTQQWVLTTYATMGIYEQGGIQKTVTAGGQNIRTVKRRVTASPFGWGISQGDLSPMQLSILGALGLSRLP